MSPRSWRATATAGPTLWAPVEVFDELRLGVTSLRVRTLPGGVGGWATPDEELTVDPALLSDISVADPPAADDEQAPDSPRLTAPIDGDGYIELLLQRQTSWMVRRWPSWAREKAPRPLLEWFVEPGDERFVQLPKPAPKRRAKPRVYRSAQSLRDEHDELERRMTAIFDDDGVPDRAIANLSPLARSRAARNAGRRRFAKLDRDLERYTALRNRLDRLKFRISAAEARERRRHEQPDT